MSIKQISGYKVFLSKLLGQGSYGAVYQGVNDKTHQRVAVKLLKKAYIDDDDYLKAALFSEIKILRSVKSQNIVGFQDVMESNQYYYVIQQLCDGDLSNIMKPGQSHPQHCALDMLRDMSNGFLALVREGIIHRDLKPANIMTKKSTLKIGDFGFAKKTPNKKVGNKTVVGTPLYMSLQVLKGQEYSSKADIWAVGFIFYELLHGQTPWIARSEYELVKNIESRPLKIKQGLSPNVVDFLKQCLQKQEKNRISWDQYFVHPVFKGYFDSYAAQNKEFENKLKTVMSELRFKINSQNLDLCKILYSLGYDSAETQMNFQEFFNFLRTIHPSISQSEAVYMFQKTDTDNSGSISIAEIEEQMTKHNISLHSHYVSMPIFVKKQNDQSFVKISGETEQKVKSCFKKMEGVIRRKGVSLNQIFNSFDKDKSGTMTFKQWKYMMSRLGKEFSDQELQSVFDLIDEDKSDTIDFAELNRYFSKVNGIPESLNAHVEKKLPLGEIPHNVPQLNKKKVSQPGGGVFGNYVMNQREHIQSSLISNVSYR